MMNFKSYGAMTKAIIPSQVQSDGNFYNAFAGMYYLTDIELPDSAINIGSICYNCYNLKNAGCGNNTTYMVSAYSNCKNLITPACGPNVINMAWAYNNCFNLTTAVCGPNVVNMYEAYYNCQNLTVAVCGPNVTSMVNAYYNCRNLKIAACGDSITSMYNFSDRVYRYCNNIEIPACGKSVINMCGAYNRYGSNLKKAVSGPNVVDMTNAYEGCTQITSATCGPNVVNMHNTFEHCIRLKSVVLGPNVQNIYNTFEACYNLKTMIINQGPPSYSSNYSLNSIPNSLKLYVPKNWYTVYTNNYRWNRFNVIACEDIQIQDLSDLSLGLNKKDQLEVFYFIYAYSETVDKKVSINCSDSSVIKVSNPVVNNNGTITMDVETFDKEGSADITITLSALGITDTKTWHVNVSDQSSYVVKDVPGAPYGFFLAASNYYQSSNYGLSNTYSLCKVEIQANGKDRLQIDCINYAESGYDFGILSTLDKTLTLSYSADSSNVFKSFKNSSSSSVQTVDYGVLSKGEHFIYIKYRKDSSGNSGNDSLKFKIRFVATD